MCRGRSTRAAAIASQAGLATHFLTETLYAVREGRSVDTEPVLAAAIYFTNVLSLPLPLPLEQLVPKLSTALSG